MPSPISGIQNPDYIRLGWFTMSPILTDGDYSRVGTHVLPHSMLLSHDVRVGWFTLPRDLWLSPLAPRITSPATAGGTIGTPFSYQIVATNSPTSYDATGLPAGLTTNTATGLISGTPTAIGTSQVTLSATNAEGTGTRRLTITIASLMPTIASLTPNTGPPTGGTTVVITGTNFTGATSVMFGSVAAASFAVDSATQITATSPAHTG
jgi:hypothetical protein